MTPYGNELIVARVLRDLPNVSSWPKAAELSDATGSSVTCGTPDVLPTWSSGPPLPSRPGEFHPEPLTGRVEDWRAGLGRSLVYWDRSRARPAVGGGFPFLLFRLQDGFTVPPWLTFPEAPL